MSTLNWVCNCALVGNHRDVACRLLSYDFEEFLNDGEVDSRLAQGYNFEALGV